MPDNYAILNTNLMESFFSDTAKYKKDCMDLILSPFSNLKMLLRIKATTRT
jgi:hypothetical protein